MRVTKEVQLTFQVSRSVYDLHLPAGLRVKKARDSHGTRQYFLDEFPICAKPPFTSFPRDSFLYHDAIHYGIRLAEDQTAERI